MHAVVAHAFLSQPPALETLGIFTKQLKNMLCVVGADSVKVPLWLQN